MSRCLFPSKAGILQNDVYLLRIGIYDPDRLVTCLLEGVELFWR